MARTSSRIPETTIVSAPSTSILMKSTRSRRSARESSGTQETSNFSGSVSFKKTKSSFVGRITPVFPERWNDDRAMIVSADCPTAALIDSTTFSHQLMRMFSRSCSYTDRIGLERHDLAEPCELPEEARVVAEVGANIDAHTVWLNVGKEERRRLGFVLTLEDEAWTDHAVVRIDEKDEIEVA